MDATVRAATEQEVRFGDRVLQLVIGVALALVVLENACGGVGGTPAFVRLDGRAVTQGATPSGSGAGALRAVHSAGREPHLRPTTQSNGDSRAEPTRDRRPAPDAS